MQLSWGIKTLFGPCTKTISKFLMKFVFRLKRSQRARTWVNSHLSSCALRSVSLVIICVLVAVFVVRRSIACHSIFNVCASESEWFCLCAFICAFNWHNLSAFGGKQNKNKVYSVFAATSKAPCEWSSVKRVNYFVFFSFYIFFICLRREICLFCFVIRFVWFDVCVECVRKYSYLAAVATAVGEK